MSTKNPQELSRVLQVFESVLIAISAVSPATSVFVIAPVLMASFGTASFLSLVLASAIGVAMALCWAELGATYPGDGGDYLFANRTLGPAWGFMVFGLWVALILWFVPLFALGLAGYLKVVFDADPRLVGSLAIVGAALIALLKVQVGARITGIFLTVELIALAILTYLGFAQMERPISELLHPMVTTPVGGTAPAGFGLIAAGGAVALYLQAGFNVSIYLSEETKGPSSGVARATLWSLFAVILTTVVPVAAVLVGVTSVASFATDPSLTAFLINRGGTQLNTWLSLAVAAAIFNALIAILIVNARFLFSSGRDKAWPGPIGSWLGQLHSAYRTPWIAVAGLAIIQVVITLTLDVFSLTTFIGACLTAIYFTVALAAIASRIRDRDRPRPYRMPFWPLPPVVALVALAYVMTQQSIEDIWVSIAVIILSLTFYFLYLARKPEERWLAGRVAQESAKN